MLRFIRTFILLMVIFLLGAGIYGYFNGYFNDNVDDKTNIENTVKSESNAQEDIEGTVVAKRSTENN